MFANMFRLASAIGKAAIRA